MTLDILAQKNPFLMTTIGNFNAKSKNWYSQDRTSFEDKTIETIYNFTIRVISVN